MHHSLYAADVYSKLKRRGAYGRCRLVACLEGMLSFLAKVFRKAAVMWPELVGYTIVLTAPTQLVCIPFNLLSAIGENQIVAAA